LRLPTTSSDIVEVDPLCQAISDAEYYTYHLSDESIEEAAQSILQKETNAFQF
jgi:hypothetical protein